LPIIIAEIGQNFELRIRVATTTFFHPNNPFRRRLFAKGLISGSNIGFWVEADTENILAAHFFCEGD
jgi:hypothetical protein